MGALCLADGMQVGFTTPCLDLLLRCQLGAAGGTVSPSVSPAFPTSPTRSGGSSEHPAMRDLREAAVPPMSPPTRGAFRSCATRGQHRPSRAHSLSQPGRTGPMLVPIAALPVGAAHPGAVCGNGSVGEAVRGHVRVGTVRCRRGALRGAPQPSRCPHGRARSKLTPGLFHPYSPQPQRGRSPAPPHSPAPYK